MLTALVIGLIVVDIVLLIAMVRISRNRSQVVVGRELQDLTEERRYIMELRKSIQEDLEHAQLQSKDVLKRVTQLATEAEQEVKLGGSSIATELDGIVASLTKNFEEPLNQLTSKINAGERLMQKLEREKNSLVKLMQRAEQICSFFNEKIPYQDILEELQDKKYRDARQMLAKGYKIDTIAQELGLSKAELDLIAGAI
jgi:hypothetical protein